MELSSFERFALSARLSLRCRLSIQTRLREKVACNSSPCSQHRGLESSPPPASKPPRKKTRDLQIAAFYAHRIDAHDRTALNTAHAGAPGIQINMTEFSDSEVVSTPKRSTRTSWLLVLGGLFLGVLLGLFLIPLALVGSVRTAFHALHWGQSTRIDTSAPSVVDKIRGLNRLESVDYSIDKIIEGNRQAPPLPNFLAGDRLLLIAHGEVIAGVDLSALKSGDVRVDGDTVRVRLPAAQILVSRIDNARTRVYERTTGVLVPPDPTLETQARQAAEQQITQAALDDGILDKARANAKVSITGLLYALGFRIVDVQ
jgi:hypothetical protein